MKKFISIAFLFIFFLAQFGKIVSYGYCKWENRSVIQCDCEKVFAVDDHQKDHQLSKVNSITKLEDPVISYPATWYAQLSVLHTNIHCYSSENPVTGFAGSTFHPPSLI